jgi:hypothetical protein
MDLKEETSKHITRIILGIILIVFLQFFIQYIDSHEIITKSRKTVSYYSFDLIYWSIILISFLLFVMYVLPSIIQVIKNLFNKNE